MNIILNSGLQTSRNCNIHEEHKFVNYYNSNKQKYSTSDVFIPNKSPSFCGVIESVRLLKTFLDTGKAVNNVLEKKNILEGVIGVASGSQGEKLLGLQAFSEFIINPYKPWVDGKLLNYGKDENTLVNRSVKAASQIMEDLGNSSVVNQAAKNKYIKNVFGAPERSFASYNINGNDTLDLMNKTMIPDDYRTFKENLLKDLHFNEIWKENYHYPSKKYNKNTYMHRDGNYGIVKDFNIEFEHSDAEMYQNIPEFINILNSVNQLPPNSDPIKIQIYRDILDRENWRHRCPAIITQYFIDQGNYQAETINGVYSLNDKNPLNKHFILDTTKNFLMPNIEEVFKRDIYSSTYSDYVLDFYKSIRQKTSDPELIKEYKKIEKILARLPEDKTISRGNQSKKKLSRVDESLEQVFGKELTEDLKQQYKKEYEMIKKFCNFDDFKF